MLQGEMDEDLGLLLVSFVHVWQKIQLTLPFHCSNDFLDDVSRCDPLSDIGY